MPSVDIHAEFVVSAAEILHERVPGTDHPMIGFDGLFTYCSVMWHAAGISSSITRG